MTQIYSGAEPKAVAKALQPLLAFEQNGMPLDALRSMIEAQLLPHLIRYDLPRFQSMFNAYPPAEALLGGEIALKTNQGVTNWQVSPGGALLEELCGKALCRLFGLADSADATFMYSGTYANQQAVYMALHRYAERRGVDYAANGLSGFDHPERLAILVSADAHFSLRHAVRMLGLGENAIVKLPLDEQRRIDADAAQAIVNELAETRDIFCVVATSGTTSTGAIDPIGALADLAAEVGAWLHIDGAYGYAYKLVPEWADRFAGDARADSITWDAHKQLGAPIPNSLLFVRDGADFGRMSLYSGYFNRAEDAEPNPGLKSAPTTRPMSALPLVTILRGQGLRRVVDDLRVPLEAMRQLADYLRNAPDATLCHEPDTGILCFKMHAPALDMTSSQLQRWLYEQVMASGNRTISTTTLDGETVLRVVSVAPLAQFADFVETIAFLRALVAEAIA